METFTQPISRALREVAVALPEVTEGDSCVNRAFAVRKKNFFFLGEKPAHLYMMFKLQETRAQVAEMDDPRVSVGATGWATVKCPYDDVLDEALLTSWVRESYLAQAPKALAKQVAGVTC